MISNVYAMAQSGNPQAPSGAAGLGATLFPMAVVMLIFYFLLIRPQKKKETEHRKFLDSLQKGQEVLTQAGFYGKIASVEDQSVMLELAPNLKVKVLKASISGEVKPNIQAKSA